MELKKTAKKIIVIAIILASIAVVVIATVISIKINEKKKYGVKSEGFYYINTQGEILNQVPLVNQYVSFKDDGFAYLEYEIINSEGKHGAGIIDRDGNVVGDRVFSREDICVGEKTVFPIMVRETDRIEIFDKNYNKIGRVEGDYDVDDIEFGRGFLEGICRLSVQIENKKLYGYINTEGKWIIPPQYKDCGYFSEKKIACAEDPDTGLWGYINDKGEWTVEPQYSELVGCGVDGADIDYNSETKLWRCIDTFGNQLNDDWYYDMSAFRGGYSLVQKEEGGAAAYINTKGEYITGFIFDYEHSQKGFSEGLAYVKRYDGDTYGYINEQGEYILESHYEDAMEFSCGLALVIDPLERLVYIDKSGKIILKGDEMGYKTFSSDGYAIVSNLKTHKEGMMDAKGKWLFEPQFTSIIYPGFKNGCCVVYLEKGQIIKKPKK